MNGVGRISTVNPFLAKICEEILDSRCPLAGTKPGVLSNHNGAFSVEHLEQNIFVQFSDSHSEDYSDPSYE